MGRIGPGDTSMAMCSRIGTEARSPWRTVIRRAGESVLEDEKRVFMWFTCIFSLLSRRLISCFDCETLNFWPPHLQIINKQKPQGSLGWNFCYFSASSWQEMCKSGWRLSTLFNWKKISWFRKILFVSSGKMQKSLCWGKTLSPVLLVEKFIYIFLAENLIQIA